jgi:hypothetical protein
MYKKPWDATTKVHEITKTTSDKAFKPIRVGDGSKKKLIHVAKEKLSWRHLNEQRIWSN